MVRWFLRIIAACGAAFACSSFGGGGDGPVLTNDGGPDALVPPPEASVDAGGCSITSLSVGSNAAHTCAVKADGTVWCWGSNTDGQLGIGADGGVAARPTRLDGIADAVEVAAGTAFTCARTRDGSVYCWGRNDVGQLGVGPATSRGSPAKLSSIGSVKAIAAGGYHACAITADDRLWCWGYNRYGQLGTSGMESAIYPVPALVDETVRAVSAGVQHTCVLTQAGAVLCWGLNAYAQLGIGEPDAGPKAGLTSRLRNASSTAARMRSPQATLRRAQTLADDCFAGG